MESVRREPDPGLHRLVHSYHGFRMPDGPERSRLEIPSGAVTLLLAFGEPIRIGPVDDDPAVPTLQRTSFLTAGRSTASIGRHRGRIHGLEITLSHTGAHQLFGTPMVHLANGLPTVSEVLGREGDLLVEQVAGLPTWEERFARVEAYLRARAADSPVTPSWQVTRALRLVAAGRPLRDVQRDVGWSARHLRTRFLEQVGMPPKAVARVLRLQTALRARLAGRTWAQAAALARFHDQAHLSHEVRAMTGLTPGRLAELRHGAPPGSALDRLPGRVTSVLLG
ncbi:helix-turn-helix transcriptional regulator [Catenulispora subtropica]|uniref:HTH araC/xylS-type domain-containing protein n=1 Tax=Catenulispora subtropica TaxID=450798 RepID=A0ABP5CF74_9ACTN